MNVYSSLFWSLMLFRLFYYLYFKYTCKNEQTWKMNKNDAKNVSNGKNFFAEITILAKIYIRWVLGHYDKNEAEKALLTSLTFRKSMAMRGFPQFLIRMCGVRWLLQGKEKHIANCIGSSSLLICIPLQYLVTLKQNHIIVPITVIQVILKG